MKSIHCETHNLIIKRKSAKTEFTLVVDDIFFSSPNNSSLSIPFIGRSGAGKSTLLEALAAMLWPTSGSIYWKFDNECFEWDAKRPLSSDRLALLHSKYIGFAFQDSTLTPFLTIRENLIFPQRLLNKSSDETERYAHEWVENVFSEKSENILSKYPYQLSGGQRQRASLIQAVCNDPYVLFADEPTGSLDNDTRKEVMDVIKDWQEKKSGTFLWVTHHTSDQENRDLCIQVCQGKNGEPNTAHLINNRASYPCK
ncbi:ATP-binding cassette domain-containing protein [bacterium]|nr:ATP-binding cassette domain-containing protein [bacterium]